MNTTDKALLGFCAGCLLIGLLQHSLKERRQTAEAAVTEKKQTAPHRTDAQEITHGSQKKQKLVYVVDDLPKPGTSASHQSRNQQRMNAMLARKEKREKKESSPADDFQTREAYKSQIFNDPSCTLTEAEKWELIESKAIPW